MGDQALNIKSRRELCVLYEAFSEDDDEGGIPIFLYSSFGHMTDEDVYPLAPNDITVVAMQMDSKPFFKGPKLNTAFLGTKLLQKLILQEAKTLELLVRNLHPNIVGYHGSLIKRGRIVGFALDQYPMTLEQRLKQKVEDFDIETNMGKIVSAVNHLHSLWLAHNDLTPMNVMVDKNDSPILINFSSCGPFGATLITAGTPG